MNSAQSLQRADIAMLWSSGFKICSRVVRTEGAIPSALKTFAADKLLHTQPSTAVFYKANFTTTLPSLKSAYKFWREANLHSFSVESRKVFWVALARPQQRKICSAAWRDQPFKASHCRRNVLLSRAGKLSSKVLKARLLHYKRLSYS